MAATSHPLATQVALDILKAGGSAIDAAIAANAMLGLVEPTGCGVGGDLFAIVWDAERRELRGLNGSGRSPRSLGLAELRAADPARIPPRGPMTVSVPGAVDGWITLHGEFGRIPLADVLAPAIAYAEQGVPVAEIIAGYWAQEADALRDFPGFAELYMPTGRAPRAGETFKNPRLAETYGAIATGGRAAFYEGPIAREIHDYMHARGGRLSVEDLAEHRSDWVDPVSTNYRGFDVWEIPPNNQGIAVLQMLNILEFYDLRSLGWQHPEYLHLLIEAKKLAFEDRARFYADPQHVEVPTATLVSKDYAEQRRALLDRSRASKTLDHGDPAILNVGDTVYLTAADAGGNMVSLIQSNFRGMGSGMTLAKLGFALQSRGELFSLDPAHPNIYAPDKRPFHTIIPAFVTKNGEPVMSFGVMGADMQPQGHVQILVNILDFEMNLQEAGDCPRVRHEGSADPTGGRMRNGGTVLLESGFDDEAVAALERYGHTVRRDRDGFGGYQAIWWDSRQRSYFGASESRKDGQAAGY